MPLNQTIEDVGRLTRALVEQHGVNKQIGDELERASEIILNTLAIAAPKIQQLRAPEATTFGRPEGFGPTRTTADRGQPGVVTTSTRFDQGVIRSSDRQTAGILAAIGKLQSSVDRVQTGVLFAIRNG